MKYKVDGWNNFCRVFELPMAYPEGYCFGSGKQVMMLMVDWFNPVASVDQAAVSKEVFEKEVGSVETTEVDGDELAAELIPWLQKKDYVQAGSSYLVICSFGLALTFNVEEETNETTPG